MSGSGPFVQSVAAFAGTLSPAESVLISFQHLYAIEGASSIGAYGGGPPLFQS